MVEEELCPKFDYASPTAEIPMKYWRLISLDSTGKRKSEEIPEALAFFTEAFLSNPKSSRAIRLGVGTALS